MASNNELVPAGGQQWAIANFESDMGMSLEEIIAENTSEADGINPFDLNRVKMPAGGGGMWEVPSSEGPQGAKAIEGVVVAWRTQRAYWSEPYGAGGGATPPQCYSDDGIIGHGDPGLPCGECPFSQFGSDPRGVGQACKQMRMLFMLRPQDMLPLVVILPPMSIKPCQQYFLQLGSEGRPFWSVVTSIGLDSAVAKEGQKYSKATFRKARDLAPDERGAMQRYGAQLKPLINRPAVITVSRTELEGETSDPVESPF